MSWWLNAPREQWTAVVQAELPAMKARMGQKVWHALIVEEMTAHQIDVRLSRLRTGAFLWGQRRAEHQARMG